MGETLLHSTLMLQKRLKEKDDKLIIVASDFELKEAAKSSGLDVIDPVEVSLPSIRKEQQ